MTNQHVPTCNVQKASVVELYTLLPYSTKVWRSGKSWMDCNGKVHCKRIRCTIPATHEAHIAGKTIKEAIQNIGTPDVDCVVIYKKYSKWRLLHEDDVYAILSWRDVLDIREAIGPFGNSAPITRKVKGRLVYFLRKLKK